MCREQSALNVMLIAASAQQSMCFYLFQLIPAIIRKWQHPKKSNVENINGTRYTDAMHNSMFSTYGVRIVQRCALSC